MDLLPSFLAGIRENATGPVRAFIDAHAGTFVEITEAYAERDDLKVGRLLGSLLIGLRKTVQEDPEYHPVTSERVRDVLVHVRRAHSILLDGVVALQSAEDAARAAKH